MSRRVLIVDDEFGLADVMAEILRESGYETSIAINGKLGLARLQESRPDAVLLDVMMPILSGPEMLQAMRRDPRFADLPVILMTAVPERLAGQVPPHDYQAILPKPFSPDQLFTLLDRLLGEPPR